MTELDDLLEIIAVPPTDAAADAARGEQRLRRRRRTQVGAVAVCVAAVAGAGFALHGSSGSPGAAPGPVGQPSTASPSVERSTPPQAGKRHHSDNRRLHHRSLAFGTHDALLQTYHDVLAEHLDPTGDHLRLAQNEQGGGDHFGTKLDWNDGGMLEILVGSSWAAAGGIYLLEEAHLAPTTYDGLPARVSTTGDDLVVSVRHDDGTVVTLIASTSFGNNGTSTADLGLTRHELLGAAADPRLVLPDEMR